VHIEYYNNKELSGINEKILISLIAFISNVWDKDLTIESYFIKRRNDFFGNPYCSIGGLPLALLVNDDKVIGHLTSIPCKLWALDHDNLMYWNAGLHLLDECRGRGLGSMLPQKMIDTLSVVIGFFVVPQQLKTHKKMGWTIVGKMPEYVKIINPEKFIRNIDISNIEQMPFKIRSAVRIINKLFSAIVAPVFSFLYPIYCTALKPINHHEIPRGTIRIVDEFDSRIDQLWDRVKHKIRCAQVRNAAYMNWKFNKEKGWIKIIYERGDQVLGYALCAKRDNSKESKLPGIRMYNIIDILWDMECYDALGHMLDLIEKEACNENADVIVCSINHRYAQACLLKHAFIRIPGTVHFAFHSNNSELGLSPRLEDWFITRGDADAAGSLGPE